ncbi:MAG: LemA family protein [Candidatus Anstonellales archaeon]
MDILLVVALIVIIYAIYSYNMLVELRERVRNSLAQIDVILRKRVDLVTNLVNTVKGYVKHERETLNQIIELRTKFLNSQSLQDRIDTSNMITQALKSVFAIAEAYPDLKANQNFLVLKQELSKLEQELAATRMSYNDVVQKYNTAIKIFPNNLFAIIFGFREESYLNLSLTEEERKVPKVEF